MSDVELIFEDEDGQATENNFIEDVISDEEELKVVADDLRRRYHDAKAARADKESAWAKWRRQFEARPRSDRKDYPYPNASNVSPPLAQIIGQSLFGHLKNMYDKVDPPWYVKPLREGDTDLIKQSEVLTKYFNMLSKSRLDLNLSKFERTFFQEVGVMGTCYVKVPWTRKTWNFKSTEGGTERNINAALHDGPELVIIPVEDLVYPENWNNLQTMPWVAHDFSRAGYELEDLANAGIYDRDAVDIVLQYPKSGADDEKTMTKNEIMRSDPERLDEFTLTEVYFYYDSDDDGRTEDLVFTMHMESGTVLRQGYNEFGYRMISPGTFIERTFALEGRGSGQTTEYQQDEIEGIHNVRNDNMKFANMRVLAARKNAMRQNETIYPGKIFFTDNPKEDIVPIQLGEVYPSSLNAEQQTMSYAREASGMSSIMGGFADQTLGSRDTFRGQSMRMNQGQGLFSTIAEGLNECFSEMGMMIFFQLVKNRENVMANEREAMRLTEEEIDILNGVLSMRLEEIPLKLAFQIRTSDIDQTFEAKRQNMLSLTQLFSQFAMQLTPVAMQLFGPEGQQMQQVAPDAYSYLLSIYTGSTRLMSEVFKFFGEEDPMKYLPDIRKQEMLQDMLKDMTTMMVEQGKQQQQPGQDVNAPRGPIGIEEEAEMRRMEMEQESMPGEGGMM